VTPDATPSQTVGPFFSIGLCSRPLGPPVAADAAGAVRIRGRVLDGDGAPVPDAMIEVWQDAAGWARCGTDAEGRYDLVMLRPGRVRATDGREQAPHLEVLVFARGLLRHLRTRLYLPDEEEANAADPLLAAIARPADRASLIAAPEADALRFDVHLQGERQTTFLAP
jgi:protocatechuate 3,4-dioxygenase alpha subunit